MRARLPGFRLLALLLLLVAIAAAPASSADARRGPETLRVAEQSGPAVALLESLQPVAEWSPAGSLRWQAVPLRQNVRAGDRVRTGPEGAARLTYLGGTTTELGPETSILVQQLEAPSDGTLLLRIFQSFGTTVNQVVQQAQRTVQLDIETPAVLTQSRGTTPHLEVGFDGTSRVYNVPDGTNGTVLVRGKGLGESELILEPGEVTTTVPGQPPGTPSCGVGFRGEYFPNPSLQGEPLIARCDPTLTIDWSGRAPAPGMPVDQFSVRWTGQLRFPADDTYTFQIKVDDGVRLFLDGQRLIDEWRASSSRLYSATVALTAGPHTIVVEFLEIDGDALIEIEWPVPPP